MDNDPLAAFGMRFTEYVWCLRCSRVYRSSEWREREWSCPGAGCGASAISAFRWEDVQTLCGEADRDPTIGDPYPLTPPTPAPVDDAPPTAHPDPPTRIRDSLFAARRAESEG